MLFSSREFLTWFLPLTVAGFFVLGRLGLLRLAIFWLIACSIGFYGWFRFDYVPLLLASILFNYAIGWRIGERRSKPLLVLGLAANLALIGYFKYTGMLFETLEATLGTGFSALHILLPLGISFWTFQQVAYLVDAYNGVTRERDFANYCLFILFFPQLIAGPIVHHKDMLPQFERPETFRPRLDNLALGLTTFALGLFKKVVIADPLGGMADTIFNAAAAGHALSMVEAWSGSLLFTLQLYFDFSGYSDMAIGLGLIFGVRLPINFDSPFKAASIIEFWQRWHLSLTRFLTGYVYNPILMAVTQKRMTRGAPLYKTAKPKAVPFLILLAYPTIVTMGLAGLWHGAGYQFLIFGLLHGAYLIADHAWRAIRHAYRIKRPILGPLSHPAGVLATFVAVVVSLVFFRAESVGHALAVAGPMLGADGINLPLMLEPYLGTAAALSPVAIGFVESDLISSDDLAILPVLLFIVWALPNTQQWVGAIVEQTARPAPSGLARLVPGRDLALAWRPTAAHAVLVGTLLYAALAQALSVAPNQFIYFDF